MPTLTKDWDQHVPDAEQIARGTGFLNLRDRILELASPQATDVVDVGCGTGLLTLELAGRVQRVWAIDISASMVDYVRTKAASAGLANVDAAVASAVSLPLVNACADIVVPTTAFITSTTRASAARCRRRCVFCAPADASCSAT